MPIVTNLTSPSSRSTPSIRTIRKENPFLRIIDSIFFNGIAFNPTPKQISNAHRSLFETIFPFPERDN